MSELSSYQLWEESLLAACRHGGVDQVQMLLGQQQNSDGADWPPFKKMMMAAAEHDRSDIIEYCLNKGGQVSGWVIDKVAVKSAWKSLRVLVTIGGLDINYPLEVFGDFLLMATGDDDLELVRFCLAHGADPNLHVFQDSLSPLAVAAEDASVAVAAELIRYGARVNGSGAIVLAAQEGKTDFVRLLLEHGADVDELGVKVPVDERMDEDMSTPLHKAVEKRHVDMIRFLLEHGRANARKPDFLGRTPVQWARQLGHEEEAAILEAHLAAE